MQQRETRLGWRQVSLSRRFWLDKLFVNELIERRYAWPPEIYASESQSEMTTFATYHNNIIPLVWASFVQPSLERSLNLDAFGFLRM